MTTVANAAHFSPPVGKLEIYDTTLRDGTQGMKISMSLADKLAITTLLDDFGVDFIEGGWPGSNPKDEDYFARVRDLPLKHAKVSAFGSTRRAKNGPEHDENLQKLVRAAAGTTCIFGKTWDLHVRDALRITLDENLQLISDSVAYLVSATARPVFYDAEHFFDGYKANPDYALKTLVAAWKAGASRLVLCDTNGGSMPDDVRAACRAVQAALPGAYLGIHVHNDGGLAVANTLVAVQEGAVQIQGTINGIGERCGNADLTSVIAACELKLNKRCLPEGKLSMLTEISRTVWERVNMVGPLNQPYVGPGAFAHKGGIHVSAMARNDTTYEHVRPAAVGNTRLILISELSGRSNILAKLDDRHRAAVAANPKAMEEIIDDVMQRENEGYSFEAADASFDLLVGRRLHNLQPLFTLHHYHVSSRQVGSAGSGSELVEAVVRLTVAGEAQPRLCVAEGHGPVDALSHALRSAIEPSHPELKDLHLIDYKVRVVNSSDGTAAKVRVLIEHQYHGKSVGTVGVSENIIAASYQALVEAIEFALYTGRNGAVAAKA